MKSLLKLYLNKRDNILYIGETGSSGSALYYYDATTLQLKSFFRKDIMVKPFVKKSIITQIKVYYSTLFYGWQPSYS